MLSERLSVMVSFNPLIPPILGVVKKLGDTPRTLGPPQADTSFVILAEAGIQAYIVGWDLPTACSLGTASIPAFNPLVPPFMGGE